MKNDIALITPISKDLLYVKIADAIHAYIQQNNLQPGDRIPSERALSEQFQTGRHSVREALRVLENKGVIEVRMGRGTYVAETAQHTSFYLEFVKVNYLEMLNIKTELEKYAVRLTIPKATPAQLDKLEEYLVIMEKGCEEGHFLSDVDKKFHRLLASLSGNKMLVQMISKMIETFDEYYVILLQNEQMCMDTIPWHRVLLDAMREHDEDKAADACDHILELDVQLILYANQTDGNSAENSQQKQ